MSLFVEKEDDTATCRICFEPEMSDEELISPCDCAGSQKYVHLSCLSKWQATGESICHEMTRDQ